MRNDVMCDRLAPGSFSEPKAADEIEGWEY